MAAMKKGAAEDDLPKIDCELVPVVPAREVSGEEVGGR
jgi:hypothetical protein